MRYEDLHTRCALPETVFQKLCAYHDLLLKWQKRVNLIAPSTAGDVWERHILDSLQLLPHLRHPERSEGSFANAQDDKLSVADIGSGAGFPGLALAICGAGDITLIESDRKKCEFLREAARVTDTKIEILNLRAETVTEKTFDCLVSRATAPLETLFEWAAPLLHAGSICLFHKGENWATESDAAKKNWAFDLEVLPSESSATGCIIKATNLTKRPKSGP